MTVCFSSIEFYLILDVAVGGTNGWFPDGSEKPWLDGSRSKSFARSTKSEIRNQNLKKC